MLRELLAHQHLGSFIDGRVRNKAAKSGYRAVAGRCRPAQKLWPALSARDAHPPVDRDAQPPATNRRLPGPGWGHLLTGEQHWAGGVRPSAIICQLLKIVSVKLKLVDRMQLTNSKYYSTRSHGAPPEPDFCPLKVGSAIFDKFVPFFPFGTILHHFFHFWQCC